VEWRFKSRYQKKDLKKSCDVIVPYAKGRDTL
jgi:hypothetical protein